jgi:hypothetical protein
VSVPVLPGLYFTPVGHVVNAVCSSHQIIDALYIGELDVLLDVGFQASHIVELQFCRTQVGDLNHQRSDLLVVRSDRVGLPYSLEAFTSVLHRVDES